MTVTSGRMQVKLPSKNDWQNYSAGETFRIESNQSFDIKMDSDTAYLCVYK